MTSRPIAQYLPLLLVFVAYKLIYLLCPTTPGQTSNSTSSYRLFMIEIRAAVVVLLFLKMTSLF